MSSTRELAVIALNKILVNSKHPKDVLGELFPEGDRRERSFLMELVYGVLRHRDYLDWMLADFLKKPEGLSTDTLNNLRLAVYQVKFMRVPEWAAVNEAVELEKAYKGRDSLVNAVLRNFLRRKDAITAPHEKNPVEYLSITTSHPKWLIKRWIKRFGYEEAAQLARRDNDIPPLTIRVDDAAEREQTLQSLIRKGITARPTAYAPTGIVIEGGHSISELSEIAPFNYVVQDEASQLIAYLVDPSPGERVLDACAAPGGKSTHMARLMDDSGEITAVEADEKRIRQLQENVARLGLHSIGIVHADVKELERTPGCGLSGGDCSFDRILLDAPCSSLGVIRRNPDVKYRHSPKELARLRENQAALLRSVSRYLKAGGVLVYSVCSTEPEEGEEVIGGFLQDHPDFSIIKGGHDFLRPFEIGEAGRTYYRTFPHRHDMDGFFAARLRKGK